jgi:uncharacterized protein (TIGR02145 family)
LKDESGYKVLCGGDSVGVLLNGKTGATGKQGVAGATGAKGDTGKTGESCTAQKSSTVDGYDVLCGGKVVGTLKNGTNGTNGTNGESCKTSTADNGIVITCPNQTPVTLTNGVGCSGQSVTDKKTGLHGVAITCGSTKDTIWDGAAAAGSECTRTDKGDGSVTVKCGDAEAFTIYKAVCGAESYDPEKKFCVLGKTYDLCNGKTFVVNRQYCNNGVVDELCAEVKKSKGGSYSVVDYRPVTSDEFCLAGIITKKCGGEEFGMNGYCGKKANGTADSIMAYCRDADAQALDEAYSLIGQSIYPKDEETEQAKKPSFFGNLVGEPLIPVDDVYLTAFFASLEALKASSCTAGGRTELCGTQLYYTAKQFCDFRDNRLYNYKTVGEGEDAVLWMTENLAYEYKLPEKAIKSITPAQGDQPADTTFDLKILGGKLKYENDAFENFKATKGRYYTWKAAVGDGDLRKEMGAVAVAERDLKAKDMVVGACPNGWRLPTDEELDDLSYLATKIAEGGYADLDNDKKVVLNFNVDFLGYYDVDDKAATGSEAYFWSATEAVNNAEQAWGLVITNNDKSSVSASNKTYAFTIRCVYEGPKTLLGEPAGCDDDNHNGLCDEDEVVEEP